MTRSPVPRHDDQPRRRGGGLLSKLVAAILIVAIAVCGGVWYQAGAPAASRDVGVAASQDASQGTAAQTVRVARDGSYTSRDEVAAYIHEFGTLPGNFVSKTKARKAGWDPATGNLDDVLPGKSIGGGEFYDDDDALPDAPGRTWTECDVNYHGGRRGPERIVFSNDGLIYYTADHYQTFERLY